MRFNGFNIFQVKEKTNSAKGQESYDTTLGNQVVSFFNKNVSTYPTEVGSPKFDLVPIKANKDKMINVARLHAQQEYDRIMELVNVLQKQAEQIKRRLELTDMVHAAYYNMDLAHGQIYWLAYDYNHERSILIKTGPDEWSAGKPDHIDYIIKIKWLGDYTWIEV